MEYLNDWGTFAEPPLEFIMMNINKHYSHLLNKVVSGDLAPAMKKPIMPVLR